MKNKIFTPQCLGNFILVCTSLFLFATSGFSQAAFGSNPTFTFYKTQGGATTGSPIGNMLFRYMQNGQHLPAGASIQAIAANDPLNDFLAMDLSFSTGITGLEERFRIMGNGNIGVNTADPDARLNVQQFLTTGNLSNALFKVTGGQETSPSAFSIFNQANNRLQAILDGNLTVNKGNINILDGRLMVNTADALEDYVGLFNGSVIATEFWVKEYFNWPDYVFLPSYRLMSLSEIDAFIKAHGHLPNIPSASEIASKGYSLASLQAKSMEKIEELTLHMIAQEKAHERYVEATEERMNNLELRHQEEIALLKAQMNTLLERIDQQ